MGALRGGEKSSTKTPASEDSSQTSGYDDGTGSPGRSADPGRSRWRGVLRRIHDAVTYVPPRCRWDPRNPPRFSAALNLLFGVAGCVTVACLYYSHPLLAIFAHDFEISDYAASQVPTLSQAGYAVGLLFVCPLGDQVPRRHMVLLMVWLTSTLWFDQLPSY